MKLSTPCKAALHKLGGGTMDIILLHYLLIRGGCMALYHFTRCRCLHDLILGKQNACPAEEAPPQEHLPFGARTCRPPYLGRSRCPFLLLLAL